MWVLTANENWFFNENLQNPNKKEEMMGKNSEDLGGLGDKYMEVLKILFSWEKRKVATL